MFVQVDGQVQVHAQSVDLDVVVYLDEPCTGVHGQIQVHVQSVDLDVVVYLDEHAYGAFGRVFEIQTESARGDFASDCP